VQKRRGNRKISEEIPTEKFKRLNDILVGPKDTMNPSKGGMKEIIPNTQ
jgi:hypothetical protein